MGSTPIMPTERLSVVVSRKEVRERIRKLRENNRDSPEFKRLKTELMMLTYLSQDGRCAYCKVVMELEPGWNQMTKEHRIPKSQGGVWVDDPLLTCLLCNNGKSDMSEEEFLNSFRFKSILLKRRQEKRERRWALELNGA